MSGSGWAQTGQWPAAMTGPSATHRRRTGTFGIRPHDLPPTEPRQEAYQRVRGQAAARLIWSLKITQRWPRSALSQGLVERFGVFQALAKQ